MRALVLDKQCENIIWLNSLFKKCDCPLELIDYKTPMSFVIGVHDELNGNADLMFIYIENDDDEGIMLAEDVQR